MTRAELSQQWTEAGLYASGDDAIADRTELSALLGGNPAATDIDAAAQLAEWTRTRYFVRDARPVADQTWTTTTNYAQLEDPEFWQPLRHVLSETGRAGIAPVVAAAYLRQAYGNTANNFGENTVLLLKTLIEFRCREAGNPHAADHLLAPATRAEEEAQARSKWRRALFALLLFWRSGWLGPSALAGTSAILLWVVALGLTFNLSGGTGFSWPWQQGETVHTDVAAAAPGVIQAPQRLFTPGNVLTGIFIGGSGGSGSDTGGGGGGVRTGEARTGTVHGAGTSPDPAADNPPVANPADPPGRSGPIAAVGQWMDDNIVRPARKGIEQTRTLLGDGLKATGQWLGDNIGQPIARVLARNGRDPQAPAVRQVPELPAGLVTEIRPDPATSSDHELDHLSRPRLTYTPTLGDPDRRDLDDPLWWGSGGWIPPRDPGGPGAIDTPAPDTPLPLGTSIDAGTITPHTGPAPDPSAPRGTKPPPGKANGHRDRAIFCGSSIGGSLTVGNGSQVVDVYPFLAPGDAGVWTDLAHAITGGAWSASQVFESFDRGEVEAAKQLCEELEYTAGKHGYAPIPGDILNSWNFWRTNDPVPAFWQEDANPYYAELNMGRITLHSQWLDGNAPADGSAPVGGLFEHLNLVKFIALGNIWTEHLEVEPGCTPATPNDRSCECESDYNCDRIPFYRYRCEGHGCPEIPAFAGANMILSDEAVAWIENDLAPNWTGARLQYGNGCIEITEWADSHSRGSGQIGRSRGVGEWVGGPGDPGIWEGYLYVQYPGPHEPVFWVHDGTLTANLREARPSNPQ